MLLLLFVVVFGDIIDDGGGVVICSIYTFKLGLVNSAVVKCLLVGVFLLFGEDSEKDALLLLLLLLLLLVVPVALFGESTCESGLLGCRFVVVVVVVVAEGDGTGDAHRPPLSLDDDVCASRERVVAHDANRLFLVVISRALLLLLSLSLSVCVCVCVRVCVPRFSMKTTTTRANQNNNGW